MTSAIEDKPIAQVLAEFVTGRKFENLPKETIDKAKQHAIDITGCIIGASREPQTQALLDVMREEGGSQHSSVFAQGFKTSVMNAALMNGTTGHVFDFDDDHREGTMHPSVVVFPAVFALGEKLKVTGEELLRAFILGLEVMIRVGESFLGKSYYQGFHPTGTCGVFGAAAGCSLLQGLNVEQMTYALGLAGSFSSGTMEWKTKGAWQKPLQAGHPAMTGVLAASLAKRNFIGADTIFEGPDGAIRAFSFKDQYDYGRITENLGRKWEMADTSIKVHASCRFSAPATDCALDLYRQGVRAKDVKSILARVSAFTVTALCHPLDKKLRPVTHVDAQFSLPYAIAVAICKNRTGVDEFREEVLSDPEVLKLAEKVTWEVDPEAEALYPKAYPAKLEATLHDGRKFKSHVDFPKGDPENPATTEEIVNKFHLLTERFFDSERRQRIVQSLMGLEKVGDISRVADLLR